MVKDILHHVRRYGDELRELKPQKAKALSQLEETFALHLAQSNIPEMPVREFRFCERKWRLDFAWPDRKLAVEIHGKKWGGRHTHPQGFENDREKMNTALLMGWRVLEFTGDQVNSLEAIRMTREALHG